jgi:hypothetical protein
VIGRLALRSLTAHPVRTAVLAAGFGVGVAVMAILLGVAAIVLEQAQSPAIVGGGDVLIRTSEGVPARLLLAGTLQADRLRPRIRAASPFHVAPLYLMKGTQPSRVDARGGIPSLERALGDPETTQVAEWRDAPADTAWTSASPDAVLRQIDRFHPVPDVPRWAGSWAEWLYFNGRAANARFYLTFLVGPRTTGDRRSAGVRLQLERDGSPEANRMETFAGGADISEADALRAPDLTIGGNSVTLSGLRYHVHLDLTDARGRRVRGDLTLDASPGKLVPPVEIGGAGGWRTGYVVPVMGGVLDGTLDVDGEPVSLRGGTGYHDHNWGFWEGVSWQWGQVQQGGLSFLFGRVFPPREAADVESFPGFIGALGPDGPIGYSSTVRITERNDASGRPSQIVVSGRGPSLDVTLRFDVASIATSRTQMGLRANDVEFLQMRGQYTVTGRAGNSPVQLVAPGAAETFRGVR